MSLRKVLPWLVPIAVAGVWVLSLDGPDVVPRPDAPAELDEPSAEPEAMPEPVAAPAAPRVPLSPPPAPPAPAPPAAAAGKPPAVSALPAPAPARPEPAADAPSVPSLVFSAAFLDEERDPSWAPEAEAKIRAAFHDALVPESALLAVQCRETLCKIDMLFDRHQQDAFAAATRALRADFAPEISLDRQSAPSNVRPERMTAYVPRQGRTLKQYVQ